MDRHKLEQLRDKVGELLRFGSSSCIRQAHGIMTTEFENVLYFALEKTEPKSNPQHTIADNYPAGGIPEPCTFCENYEELENKNAELQAKLDQPIAEHPDVQRLIGQVVELQAKRDGLLKFIEENNILDMSEDLNYHKSILDGSWPQSVEILTRALDNAKSLKGNTND